MLADVTSEGQHEYATEQLSITSQSMDLGDCELWVALKKLVPESKKTLNRLEGCHSLAEYTQRLQPFNSVCENASPASWFNRIVKKFNSLGHDHRFLNPREFVEAFDELGITVRYSEVSTPWFFPNRQFAVNFLSSLFGVNEYGAEKGLDDCLATQEFDGCFVVGWRLGFYVLCKA